MMGRIADEQTDDAQSTPWTNKVDDILAELDDADRAIVLEWLLGDLGARVVSAHLDDYDITCSADAIWKWRSRQSRGKGMQWAA